MVKTKKVTINAPLKTKDKTKTKKSKGEPSRSSILRAARANKEVLEFGRPAVTLNTWKDFHKLSAVDAFRKLYGFHPNVNLLDSKIIINKKNARDWWERAGAQQQCNNVIGSFVDSQECYICGLPIAAGNEECEHILSVFKAASNLHLYRNAHKEMADPGLKYELLLEYRWAHRCCNQVKSDLDFITVDDDNVFSLDIDITKYILREIIKGIKSGKDICSDADLKKSFIQLKRRSGEDGGSIDIDKPSDVNKWIQERIDHLQAAPHPDIRNPDVPITRKVEILESEVNPAKKISQLGKRAREHKYNGPLRLILDYLNGKNRAYRKTYKNLFDLASLAKTIMAVDMTEMHHIWRKQAGLAEIPDIPENKIVKKEEVETDILVMFKRLAFDWSQGVKNLDSFYSDFMEWPVNRLKYRMKGDSKIEKELVSAGKLSLEKKISTNPFVKDFFDDVKTLMQYYVSPNMNEMEASAVAGLSYSVLLIMTYVFKIKSLREDFLRNCSARYAEECSAQYAVFVKQFKDILREKCNELEEQFSDEFKVKEFLKLFNALIKRSNSVLGYTDSILAGLFDVTEEDVNPGIHFEIESELDVARAAGHLYNFPPNLELANSPSPSKSASKSARRKTRRLRSRSPIQERMSRFVPGVIPGQLPEGSRRGGPSIMDQDLS